jgi:hypothetical protein
MVWIGLIWLRIGRIGGLLWTRKWTFGFYKMLGSSWVAAQYAASEKRLRCMKPVCYYVHTVSEFLPCHFNSTMLGSLTTSEHQLYSVSPLKTPFGLLIPLLQSSPTRNYIHSQLFLRLCHIYTAYNHTRSWLQSLITLLHWLTSQLSITVSNYHRRYIFTLRNSSRDCYWLVGLLLTNCLLNNHSGNWTKPANNFAYIAELC